MNFNTSDSLHGGKQKVVSMFGRRQFDFLETPINVDLLEELPPQDSSAQTPSLCVKESHSTEQSIYILEEQLRQLRLKIHRMSYYLEELEDIIVQ